MTKDELMELADRCEREEASWRLTCEIEAAITGATLRNVGNGEPIFLEDDTRPLGRRQWRPQPYTTSLDAAVTLVPENFSYELAFSAAGEGAMRRARLWDWRRGPLMIDPANEWAATAKSLPLALCAAALRARASLTEKE